jgi:DNA-binding transcriptional MerR regulator
MGSMRVYSREELERLRVIKYLVDELGINLAGVQRLLSIAEVVQRIRPLMDENALTTNAGRRQLMTEMRRLNDMIGL